MLKIGRIFVRSAAALLPPTEVQPRAYVSTGSRSDHEALYEFRTYCIRPDQNSAFLKLTNEKIHLRTAHSELIGYWSVECGGLNQVFHIWKYDSFSQRAAVRAGLANDLSWMSEYISKAIPMLRSQDNEVTRLLPWSRLQRAPQEGGVFELVSYHMYPGGGAVWADALQDAISSHDALGNGKLLGAFSCEVGHLDAGHALWWWYSADQRTANRLAAPQTSGADSISLRFRRNKVMFSCPFSPMK